MLSKDYSKTNFTIEKPSWDLVNTGCLQRIADACELMARRHTELISERDRYKRYMDDVVAERDALERSNKALRGQITKLKKRLAERTQR